MLVPALLLVLVLVLVPELLVLVLVPELPAQSHTYLALIRQRQYARG